MPLAACKQLCCPSAALLQRLVMYLARLDRHAGSCSAEGLAGVLGPVLLVPEQYLGMLAVTPPQLTGAAIWVVQALIM